MNNSDRAISDMVEIRRVLRLATLLRRLACWSQAAPYVNLFMRPLW